MTHCPFFLNKKKSNKHIWSMLDKLVLKSKKHSRIEMLECSSSFY